MTNATTTSPEIPSLQNCINQNLYQLELFYFSEYLTKHRQSMCKHFMRRCRKVPPFLSCWLRWSMLSYQALGCRQSPSKAFLTSSLCLKVESWKKGCSVAPSAFEFSRLIHSCRERSETRVGKYIATASNFTSPVSSQLNPHRMRVCLCVCLLWLIKIRSS